ncbi:MAG: HdeA/HdeB family chaperone [Beijerinckiaceae bacterium]
MHTSNTTHRGEIFGALGRMDLRVALVAAATLIASASASKAQVELKTYADAKGYLNVRALTCAQLANTYQEDADFLGVWYSGWWNGHLKRHSINVDRTKQGIHEVIVYCKAHPDVKVIDAVDAYVKKVQSGGQ